MAQRGDEGLFAMVDANSDGEITLEEWKASCTRQYDSAKDRDFLSKYFRTVQENPDPDPNPNPNPMFGLITCAVPRWLRNRSERGGKHMSDGYPPRATCVMSLWGDS